MRELKFRAWDNYHKEFIFDAQATYDNQCRGKGSIHHESFQEVLEDENCIVEQSTGLKDKNGKEIYEGDILGGIWEGGYIGYCEKCKQFQYYSCGECMACSGDVHWHEIVEDDGKLEVISNVHENPELVEGEK